MRVKFAGMIDRGGSEGSISFCSNTIQLARRVEHLVLGKKKRKIVSRTCHEQGLCHEIIHGLDITYNDDTLTEKQVENLSKGLYQLIVDNPALFRTSKQGEENNGK